MANTFSQIYIQVVFAVQGRQSLIRDAWCEELYKYISGTITAMGHKSIIVNGATDHVHIFVGLRPNTSISDLVRNIKANSSRFVNERGFVRGKFAWQHGFGAFSYSHSQIGDVYMYIANQRQHHKKTTFLEEYNALLREFEIEYDEKFLFNSTD